MFDLTAAAVDAVVQPLENLLSDSWTIIEAGAEATYQSLMGVA